MKRKSMFFVGFFCLIAFLFAGSSAFGKEPYHFVKQGKYYINTDTGVTIYTVEKKHKNHKPKGVVLLIHGFGIGWPYYDLEIRDYSMMDFLARRGFDVYAIDQRGYGKSTHVNGLTVRAEQSADDLKSVVDFIKGRTGATKINIAGHSWGGVVATVFAGRYQDDVERLILIGTPYQAVPEAYAVRLAPLIAMIKNTGLEYIPNTHHLTVASTLFSYEQDVIDLYQDWVNKNYLQVPSGLLLDLENFEHAQYIPQITIPTLLINGENEYVVDFQDAMNCLHDLGSEVKDMIVMGNSSHLIFLEELAHKRLNEAVYGWFSRQD
jgi:pimeloyl-ACP methyl ester carboxylesterase